MSMKKKKVVIIGALGMDFHVFNTVFRDNDEYDVLAFTIAGEQNVGTIESAERKYPSELAGKLYPNGIPEDIGYKCLKISGDGKCRIEATFDIEKIYSITA